MTAAPAETSPALFHHAVATAAATYLITLFEGTCERIEVVGSVRRGKGYVKDVELLMIPIKEPVLDMFDNPTGQTNLQHRRACELIANGTLAYRPDRNGRNSFGERSQRVLIPLPQRVIDVLPEDQRNEILRSLPNTLHPTPNTLHPTPNTQHPTPNTQHPTPNTQHPTPNTPHLPLDLFIVHDRDAWGLQMVLRTGPADYSKGFVTPKALGGKILKAHQRILDGRLIDRHRAVPTPEETDVYEHLGIPYLAPEARL